MASAAASIQPLLEKVRSRIGQGAALRECIIENGVLECECETCEGGPAYYRVVADEGRVWVVLATGDRWLSESIEADLMHTGDKLDELIEEELVERGVEGQKPTFQHYRDEQKMFTFRTPVPVEEGDSSDGAAELVTSYLLAYEAAFRELGDMGALEDEEL